jgi:hypothetical protein
MRAALLLVAVTSLAAVALPGPVLAKGEAPPPAAEPVALPEPLTKEAVQGLVARLSDTQVRELLLAQLERTAVASAGPPAKDTMGAMEAAAGQLRDRLVEVLKAGRELPGVVPFAIRTFVGDRSRAGVALALLLLAAILAAGWAAEWLFVRLTRVMRRQLLEASGGGIWAEAGRLLARLALELVGLLLYAAAAILLFVALWQGHVPTRELLASVLFGVLIVRAVSLVTRFLLAPATPAARLLPFDDPAAAQLARDVGRATTVYASAWAVIRVLGLYGLSENLLILVSLVLGLVVVGALLSLVWRNRAPIALVIGSPAGGGLRGLLADAWPVLATAYLPAPGLRPDQAGLRRQRDPVRLPDRAGRGRRRGDRRRGARGAQADPARTAGLIRGRRLVGCRAACQGIRVEALRGRDRESPGRNGRPALRARAPARRLRAEFPRPPDPGRPHAGDQGRVRRVGHAPRAPS